MGFNTLSLTSDNYDHKFDEFYNKYGDLCKNDPDPIFIDLTDDQVNQCACEILFFDLYAIADKERYAPNYIFPDSPVAPGRAFHYPLINYGLLPDPILAPGFFGGFQFTTLIRIVLWIRSFPWFNDNAHEAHQLLELYSRIKVGATARLSRAKEEDFPWTENVLYNGNAMPLNDLEWRLYSLSGSPDENKETIFLLADKMHRFKGQKPTDGMRYFKDNEDFLKNAQIPLRELMFLRQQLFVEIVEAAENYPLFGRAKPLDLKSEQEHRAAVEQVLSLMKKHAATDFESQAQSVYEDVIEAF